MRRAVTLFLLSICCGSVAGWTSTAVARENVASRKNPHHKVWIEFRDKGKAATTFHAGDSLYDAIERSFSRDALDRRTASRADALDLNDAPVAKEYLEQLRSKSVTPLVVSNWENAVSAYLDDSEIREISELPFVRAIDPVGKQKTLAATSGTLSQAAKLAEQACGYAEVISHYGQTAWQLDAINVRPLHAMGLDATDVRLGFLDTGFRWKENSAISHAKVIFEHDYVFGDDVTENQMDDNPDQESHGTETLCTAIGYAPDTVIGPAFNATLLLAKTEDIRSESPVEEDNYTAALEDFEKRGVDITTSSLGYFGFDSGWTSYTYSDLNGHTTISARALERAASLGVLCVTAMGNSGSGGGPDVNTPGDADSILSVGAIDQSGAIANFSSIGPTSDGRIKPEIVAPGVGVIAQGPDGYYRPLNGTSFATPLVASACCLIKQAHPTATAQQIRAAVMATGDNAKTPNNIYGWGRMNAYGAALELGPIIHLMNLAFINDSTMSVCVGAASKYGVRNLSITYTTDISSVPVTVPLALVTDSLIYSSTLAGMRGATRIYYEIALTDGKGVKASQLSDVPIQAIAGDLAISVYPNPAGEQFTLTTNRNGHWALYDDAGRIVRMSNSMQSGDISIPTSGLANGAYRLMFISTDEPASPSTVRSTSVIVSH